MKRENTVFCFESSKLEQEEMLMNHLYDVIILGAECVNKSYPKFWEEFSRLGGSYEQYLR